MPYAAKILLSCPNGATPGLDLFVASFLEEGVKYVAVVGKDCSHVEDLIDELTVCHGSGVAFILTSNHPNESIAETLAFVKSLTGEYAGDEVQVVVL